MANSRTKSKQPATLLAIAAVSIIGFYLLFKFTVPAAVLAALLAALATIRFITVVPDRMTRSQVLERSKVIIDQHLEKLAVKRAQLVRHDFYGKPQLEKWHTEIDYFIAEHIRPALKPRQQSLLPPMQREIAGLIASRVERFAGTRQALTPFSETMSGTEFEAFCAEQLRSVGWSARLTQSTGDQGIDIIAEKSGLRVVLQCKLYSSPVGNAAVQEVVAGRAYAQAHRCAVVSNNTYTSHAEQLAQANDVLLLHHSQLRSLETLLSREHAVAAPSQSTLFSEPEVAPPPVPTPTVVAEHLRKPAMQAPQRSSILVKMLKAVAVFIVACTLLYWIGSITSGEGKSKRQQQAIAYATYKNDKFGYRIDHPSTFVTKLVSESGDGATIVSPDGAATLMTAASNNDGALTTKDYYEETLRSAGNGKLGYRKLGGSWFVVTWGEGDVLVYKKMFVGSGSTNSFVFTFPARDQAKYDAVVTKIEKSFKPGHLADRVEIVSSQD